MKCIITALLFLSFLHYNGYAQQNWYPFKPVAVEKNSAINMSSWLDKPAGKHGFLQMKNKDYIFQDGLFI